MLASLKPKLIEEIDNRKGVRLIEKPFTAVKQSIGLPKEKSELRGLYKSGNQEFDPRRLATRPAKLSWDGI